MQTSVYPFPWAMQVRARACITRMPTSHPNFMAQHYSIVKHSFPMTKKESPKEDCIVVFLAEKFVQTVEEVVTVKEEKDEGNNKEKFTIWTNFSHEWEVSNRHIPYRIMV